MKESKTSWKAEKPARKKKVNHARKERRQQKQKLWKEAW
jgi:hypothetical protein